MIELHIEGLACSGCVAAVEKALCAADPTARATIDLDSGLARIDTTLSRPAIVATVEAAGYDVAEA